MSTSPPQFRQFVQDHDPSGDCDSRVYVNDVRIPVAKVDVHLRKEGPLDVTRYAEVEFPAELDDEPYVELFDAIEPNSQSSFDELYIELKEPASTNDAITTQGVIQNNDDTPSYVPVFRGIVTGVGATDIAGIWQCRAQGGGHLLNKISYTGQFSRTSAELVLEEVGDIFSEKVPFDVTASTVGDIEEVVIDEQTPNSVGERRVERAYDSATGQNPDFAGRSFQGNRHVLSDVITWLKKKSGLRVWLEPTKTGAILLLMDDPTAVSHEAHYLGGTVDIITNNALSELAPINTLVAKGEAKKTFGEINDFELNIARADGTYYIAKARHETLYERSGNTELEADTFLKSDGQESVEVENDAKTALKEKIDETTLGEMVTLLHGGVTPFDTIEAQPTCAEETVEDTVPITYEISRVHHEVNPQDGVSRSYLNVGIHTDIEEDIEIVASYPSDERPEDT